MKLTDYIAAFLVEKNINVAFGMSGGAAVHMFDSIDKHPSLQMISMTHEQCAAMAADGYARATGKLGVAVTTSGPGATNLLTGVCCSFYDSIPALMLTGQVATHRLKGNRNVRQVGFQETDVVSIFAPVTKYAVQLTDANAIRYHLEKAYHIAFEGRPGPVLIDIPDDLQRAEIDVDAIEKYTPEDVHSLETVETALKGLFSDIEKAQRPVIVLGGGLKTPYVQGFEEIIRQLNVPVLLTWAGADLLDFNHPLRIGTFGVYGSRVGNFVIQNADLVITLGTRLSQNLTGGILSSFARDAKLVMVDVDENEINKFNGYGITISYGIPVRLTDFFALSGELIKGKSFPEYEDWKTRITEWKSVLPNDFKKVSYGPGSSFIDVYHFIDELSDRTRKNELFYVDTGGNLTWTCNTLRLQKEQKLFSAWNNTPMGYALPAAIGAAFSREHQHISCIIGDGGLMICLAELATVAKNNLPIKIFLINNHSHGIQKQTLQTWLGGRFVGVDSASGLAFPQNYHMLVEAFGLKYIQIKDEDGSRKALEEAYSSNEPCFIDVEINPDQKLYPVLKFGFPLENQMPFLDANMLDEQMIVEKFVNTSISAVGIKQSKEGW